MPGNPWRALPETPRIGAFRVTPISYVRNSGQVLVQYLEGPLSGQQKTVALNALSHPMGDKEVVNQVRRIRL